MSEESNVPYMALAFLIGGLGALWNVTVGIPIPIIAGVICIGALIMAIL